MEKHKDDDIAVAMRELNALSSSESLKYVELMFRIPTIGEFEELLKQHGRQEDKALADRELIGAFLDFRQDPPAQKPVLTDDQIAEALTYGSKWNHKKPQWLTRDEAIRAIKFSHGIK